LLTLSGIVIGVAMIITLVSVAEGLTLLATEFVGNYQGIFVMQKGAADDIFSRVNLDNVDAIMKMAGVDKAGGLINGMATGVEGIITGYGYDLAALNLYVGVKPEDGEMIISSYGGRLEKGRFLTDNDKYGVVIGSNIADRYNKNLGDRITFNDNKWRIVGMFKEGSGIMDDGLVIPLKRAQEINGFDDDIVTMLSVIPDDPAKIEELVRRIDLRFPHLDAISAQEASDFAGEYLTTIKAAFWLISIVAGIVGGIGVANTMITSVYERTKEIGILRAVGWTKRNIINLILTEGIALSVFGGLIGILLGSIGAQLIGTLTGFSAYVSPELTIQAFTFALTVGLVGGLYPAVKAANMDPVMALRYE